MSEADQHPAAPPGSELPFRALTESLPVLVWSSDADGRHAYFNPRWSEFTGWPREQAGPPSWKELVHPDDRERVFEGWRHCRASGLPYDVECRLRHCSGGYRWLRVMARPLHSPRGELSHWVNAATDIHDTKLLALQRELVAEEMAHRLSNFFSVIQALVVLSSSTSPAIQSYARQLADRLSALSRAYDMVRPPGESGQSLKTLVRRVLDPYDEASGIRVQIEGGDLRIDDLVASTLSLLLHELATNAAKYGAFSHPAGRVQIRLVLDEGRCRLTWKELGGPAPRMPQAQGVGFGSRLLLSCVENQLKGTMHKAWEPDGLRFVADLPIGMLEPRSGGRSASDASPLQPAWLLPPSTQGDSSER